MCAYLQALRELSKEHGSLHAHNRLPDTKMLKALGHQDLVHAIRKKHGGFVRVAAKMGVAKTPEDVAIQKQISSRANRRQKRQQRLGKHDFY